MEHEVLYLLNTLARKPELIEIPDTPPKGNSIVETLQSDFEDLLGMLPVDEALARQKLMETTVAMYEAIDPREYETHRLKRIFESEQVRTELDSNLLEQSVMPLLVKNSPFIQTEGNTLILRDRQGHAAMRELPSLDTVDILEDVKSIEVFVNGGEFSFSYWLD